MAAVKGDAVILRPGAPGIGGVQGVEPAAGDEVAAIGQDTGALNKDRPGVAAITVGEQTDK
jgi:hypothetical protein